MISQSELKAILDYDATSGQLIWRINKSRVRIGNVAGSVRHDGYSRIKFCQREYLVHRLVWFWHTGELPAEIDHINRNPSDNRIENLRPCTRSQNLANMSRRTSKMLPKGVSKSGKSRFLARIIFHGREVRLGTFSSISEASHAYLSAARAGYGEFATNGDIVIAGRDR